MILIKGKQVKMEMANGKIVRAPASYGIIHDPDGSQLPKCFVFIGPYKTSKKPVEMTGDAKSYFGSDYKPTSAVVDVPRGPWKSMGDVVQIFYKRPGKYAGKYFHLFDKRTTVLLSKCRNHFRLELPGGCIVNWRGFVYP
jgi:hypothetical protein